jgi:hypothetical protein
MCLRNQLITMTTMMMIYSLLAFLVLMAGSHTSLVTAEVDICLERDIRETESGIPLEKECIESQWGVAQLEPH